MKFKRNEVVKVNRDWLAFMADQLRLLVPVVEGGLLRVWQDGPTVPEVLENLAKALDNKSEEGKTHESKGQRLRSD